MRALLKNGGTMLLVSALSFGWVFSGWPQIFNFPPAIQKALATTATVVPTGDSVTGTWTTTPLWSKVDDDIDSPDATVINSPSGPGGSEAITFTVTCPANTDTITEANLRIRTRDSNGGARTLTATVVWSATASTDVSVPDLPGTMTNYASGNQTGLSISKATCNASTITVTPNSTGGGKPKIMEIDAINLDIVYTEVSVSAPTVTTSAASSVTTDSATLNGSVTDNGNEDASTCGFAWGTNSALSGGDTATTTDSTCPSGTGSFTKGLSSLSDNTTYYFRAYATNSGGSGYGTIQNFTTDSLVYSVSITTSGTVTYGFVEVGTASSTVGNGYTQTAQNDGNTTETLNVKSSDATGGTTWTLASSVGSDQYKHEFSTTTGSTWTVMPDNATYVLAVPSLAQSGTADFDFRLTTPSSSTDYQQKSITITIQAVSP